MFFFKFILGCQQSDNCSHCSPQVSFTSGKFAAGIIDTCGNFAASVVDTGGAP
jgi:hypothetical protein